MRCSCCNRILSDYEATRRHAQTTEFLDICNKCLDGLGIEYIERTDLKRNEEMVDDMEEEYVSDDWDSTLSEMS